MPFLPDIVDEATARAAAEKKQRYADELRQQMVSQLHSEAPSAGLRKDARARVVNLVEPVSPPKASQENTKHARAFDPAPPPWALRPNNLNPARTARVGATSFNAEMQLQSLLLPSESMRDRNETEQLSARAAYGAELRRQIDEKEREKRMKKVFGQPLQSQSNHSVEHGVYSRNRYEFERARVAGGSFGFGTEALQRSAANGSVLPPLNMDPAYSNADNIWNRPAVQRQQQPDFRAKNEITAPGKYDAATENERKRQQQEYRESLLVQAEDNRRRKEAEKDRHRQLELKEERSSSEYNPFGRPGAGAPLRDNSGRIIADIRGAGITGSGDRDWAPNPAFDVSIKSFDSHPQDGYDKFDLKRMARERVVPEQSSKNQIRELDHQSAKNQSQILQRQLLEQQIAENAARKEAMRARLAKQELQDEEKIARQMNAGNGGSNEDSPPSRAIISGIRPLPLSSTVSRHMPPVDLPRQSQNFPPDPSNSKLSHDQRSSYEAASNPPSVFPGRDKEFGAPGGFENIVNGRYSGIGRGGSVGDELARLRRELHAEQERLRFHMLKQRDTVMSFRHERDIERLSPNMAVAASPSDLSVKVGAGSSEFVFPEDRNRYRGGLMLDSGEWLTDHSPDRQPQQTSFEVMKPRLSRVQLPTHFSTDDVERSENDFERAQWSARDEKLFGGEADPMGAGGDGALESDSNFIGSGEEAVFHSP